MEVPGFAVDEISVPSGSPGTATLYVRPHDIALGRPGSGSAVVRFVSSAGSVVRIEVEVPHAVFDEAPIRVGDRIDLRVRGRIFTSEGEDGAPRPGAVAPRQFTKATVTQAAAAH